MTGATLIDDDFNIKLEDVQLKHFGSAKQVQIDATFTNIVGGGFQQEVLDQRIDEIRAVIAHEENSKNMK